MYVTFKWSKNQSKRDLYRTVLRILTPEHPQLNEPFENVYYSYIF